MLLLPESTTCLLLLKWALQWPLGANLASSTGEDETSVIQYQAGAHRCFGWPNPVQIVRIVPKVAL